jgi:transcriptional regulator with XRE-family HTH domain
MNTDIGKRLILLRKALGLTQKEFAKEIHMKQPALSNIEKSRNGMKDSSIQLIVMTFNVSEHWLRTGEGEMLTPKGNLSSDEEELMKIYNELNAANKMIVRTTAKAALQSQASIKLSTVTTPADADQEKDALRGLVILPEDQPSADFMPSFKMGSSL